METKIQIRKYYKQKRDSIPKNTAKEWSNRLSRHILRWEVYQQEKKIYFYYPLGQEVSLMPVILDALSNGKQAAFPKVTGNQMQFYEITSLGQLAEGCFHVMEPQAGPAPDTCPKLAEWEQALCFVPGVAFDRAGVRFGYGKGYYDRYFAGKSGCRLAGCAYECQVAEKLPSEPWDIKMNDLITEKGICQMLD